MDKKTKAKAIELLIAKKSNPSLTYADIERKTGYSRRQLIGISKQIDERGAEGAVRPRDADAPRREERAHGLRCGQILLHFRHHGRAEISAKIRSGAC
jgi:hypothetical protein